MRSRRTIKPTKRLYEDDDEQPPELSFIARAARSHQEASELAQAEVPASTNTGHDADGDVLCPKDLSIDNILGHDSSIGELNPSVLPGSDPFAPLGPTDILEPSQFQLPHLDSHPSMEAEPLAPPTDLEAQPIGDIDAKLSDGARPSRRSNRRVVQSLPTEDEDFIDAGAVDDGEDSDASEMSKEAKGDHDVKIEDFDRPVMESLQSIDDVATALEGKTAAGEPGNPGAQPVRKSLGSAQLSDADLSKGPVARKPQKPASGGVKKVNKPVPAAPTPQPLKPAAPGARSPAEIRQNAAAKYKEVLEAAANDAQGKSDVADGELGDPAQLAEQIETEAHTAYGNPVKITPKYTAQFRMLFFALRKNHEAALQVLQGALTPAALVRMSKEALADSQAVKLRQAVLEKSRRMAVLDDEAAAQFSTAANHALRQRELQDKIDRETQAREAQKAADEQAAAERRRAAADRASVVAQHALLSQVDAPVATGGADAPYDPESVPWDGPVVTDMDFEDAGGDGGEGSIDQQQEVLSISDPGSPPAHMASRMDADTAGVLGDVPTDAAADAPPRYEGGRSWVEPGVTDRDATPPLTDSQRAALPGAGAGAAAVERPRRTSGGGASGTGNDGGAAFAHVEDLAPLVLTTPEGQVGGGAPGVRLWTGFVEFLADAGTVRAELASLQGAADLSSVVRGAIVVKGTLAKSALASFFEQLSHSRSRTVTLGVLRLSKKGLEEDSLNRVNKIYQEYVRTERCCACFPGNQESYLIPSGMFAQSLCATAYVAAHPRHKPSIRPSLHHFEFILAVVTKREAKDDILYNDLNARLRRDTAWNEKRARFAKNKSRHRKERPSHGRSSSGRPDRPHGHHDNGQDGGGLAREDSNIGSGALTHDTSGVPPAHTPVVPSDPRQARRAAAAAAAASSVPEQPAPPAAADPAPPAGRVSATAPEVDFGGIGVDLNSLVTQLGIEQNAAAGLPEASAGFPMTAVPAPTFPIAAAAPAPPAAPPHPVARPQAPPESTKASEDLPNIASLLEIIGGAGTSTAQVPMQPAPRSLDIPSMHAPAQLPLPAPAGMHVQPHGQPHGQPHSQLHGQPHGRDQQPLSGAPMHGPGHIPRPAQPGRMGAAQPYQPTPSQPAALEHARPQQLPPPQTLQPPPSLMHPHGMPSQPQYSQHNAALPAAAPQMSQQMHAMPAPVSSMPLPVQYAPQQPQQTLHGNSPGRPVIIQASPGTLHAAAPQVAQPRYAPQPVPQAGPPQAGRPQHAPPQPGAYPGRKMGASGYAAAAAAGRDSRGSDGRGNGYASRHDDRSWGDDIMARAGGNKRKQWDDRGAPRPGPEPGYDVGGRYDGNGGRGGRRRMGGGDSRRGPEADESSQRGGRGRPAARRENTHTLTHLHAPPPDHMRAPPPDLLPTSGRGRGPALHPPPPPPPP